MIMLSLSIFDHTKRADALLDNIDGLLDVLQIRSLEILLQFLSGQGVRLAVELLSINFGETRKLLIYLVQFGDREWI